MMDLYTSLQPNVPNHDL
jgi:hypothetical protein